MSLAGKIAIVTGASRGIGRGIALQLGEAGATVYITGRPHEVSISQTGRDDLPSLQKTADEITERGGKGIAKYVDHSDMNQVKDFFSQVQSETDGTIDILVNNAYSAVPILGKESGKPFWETDPSIWDEVNNVGLRNHYFCSVYAARLMVKHRAGLIVNISSFGGLQYFFNVSYGVGKCALDRMAADMACELRKYNVSVVSLWPGVVRTELFSDIVNSADIELTGYKLKLKTMLEDGETVEFSGKAVVALANDRNILKKTGSTLVAADIGLDYRFCDVDGRAPPSIRSIKNLLNLGGYKKIAEYVPSWLRLPGWLMVAVNSRL